MQLNNDEDFELKEVSEIKNISEEPVTLKISSHPNKLKLGNHSKELFCSLSLLGLSAEIEEIEKNREGIDLVFVVDISGSMGSGKLELVKVTISFVLTILKDFDRVCIIGFSDQAFILCPLLRMNEEGKARVSDIIRSMGPTGGTQIEAGVRAALHVLADRKKINQITSIMLLSDGVDNSTATVNQRSMAAIQEFKPKIQDSFKMHTYGYGTDHDSRVMNLLAELTRGNFYIIENEAKVSEAFSNCMGELVSLVANKVHVNLTTLPCEVDFRLKQVFSINEDTSFDLPDLFFDDQQDAVFILEFPPSDSSHAGITIRPVKAVVSYVLKGGSSVMKEVFLDVDIVDDDNLCTSNKEVLLEYYRVRGALVLKQVTKLADVGKLEEARQEAHNFEEQLKNCEVKDNQKIKYLLEDIIDSQKRTQSAYAWNSGGRAQVTSVTNTHFSKISSNNCVSYQKPVQCMYSASSMNYAQTVQIPPNYPQNMNVSIPMNHFSAPAQPNLFQQMPQHSVNYNIPLGLSPPGPFQPGPLPSMPFGSPMNVPTGGPSPPQMPYPSFPVMQSGPTPPPQQAVPLNNPNLISHNIPNVNQIPPPGNPGVFPSFPSFPESQQKK
jgi:hypothetical protein